MAGDARFFARSGPFALADLAVAAGLPAPDAALTLTGIAPLQTAGPDEVSFIDNAKYGAALAGTRAGVVLVRPALADRVPAGTLVWPTDDPYLAWARVASLFHPVPPTRPGIHPSAVIDPMARIDPSAEIGPLCVVGARAEIGPRSRLGSHVSIGEGVVLGEDCRVGAHASIRYAILGRRVVVRAGARIGEAGFGFAPGPAGFVPVPQVGRVLIEDDVDIGANTAIDRGSVQDTVIGAGTRIDNLVQIGHNCRVGRMCVIAALAGLSGSITVEDFVMLGGQVGSTGHITIGARARVGAQAGIIGDIAPGTDVIGSPAWPARDFWRAMALLRRSGRRGGPAI